jgi:hypothetical protein
MSERTVYMSKLCSSTTGCHDTPILETFEQYKSDVLQCYSSQMFNFDHTIFDVYEKNVTDFIKARKDKARYSELYDLLNIRARDEMNAVLDTVRLRDGYLKKFRYSQAKTVFGDISLHLKHKCNKYEIDSENQLDSAGSFLSLSGLQLMDMQTLSNDLVEASIKYKNAEKEYDRAEKVFREFVVKVQENVIDSLITITP